MGGGGKGGGGRRPVVDYFMSMHFGIAHEVDELLEVWVKEKSIWRGSVSGVSTVDVSLRNLFGGNDKEGGVDGQFTFLQGKSDQVLPGFLASRLGRTSATAPGFRGVSTIFFHGRSAGQGFMWQQNNPYQPTPFVKVFRAPKGLSQGTAVITGPNGSRDANGSHIIFECLTNTNWGMGAPTTAIDVPTFEAAATTLFNEQFGLSLMWKQPTTIEAFISEVLDHIQGTLFVNPRTGLYTLKLIRDDYDINNLRTLTPDDTQLINFQRKLFGETINEIVVTWTNPESEEEETITFQDLGNIAAQGGVVSESRNYYGIRNRELATQVGARDLRSAAAPLISAEIETNREGWNLVPGDVVRLTWPDYGVVSVIMRVGKVDYGRPGDMRVRVSLVEDIFSLQNAEFDPAPETEWIDPAQEPRPMTHVQPITPPLPLIAAQGVEDIDSLIPQTFPAILAAQDDEDTIDFNLVVPRVIATGETVREAFSSYRQTPRTLLSVPLAEEVESTIPEPGGVQGGVNILQVGSLVRLGPDDDTLAEFALVTATDGVTYTLARGIYDTVPRAWPAGTPIWFIDNRFNAIDPIERVIGESVEYQILPRTSLGILDVAEAPTFTYAGTDRPYLPFRPANVTINGSAFGPVTVNVGAGQEDVAITWATRNRFLEDAVARRWTDASVTPEADQITVVEFRSASGVTLDRFEFEADTSTLINFEDIEAALVQEVAIFSERDGDRSLQSIARPLVFTGLPPDPYAQFVWTEDLLVHVSAGRRRWVDPERSSAAGNGDRVGSLRNYGSLDDIVQGTLARRPILRTNGINGRPYLECDASAQHFFEDFAFTQPSGVTSLNPYVVFAVTDAINNLDDFPAVIGSSANLGGKNSLYFRPVQNEQIHFAKSQIRFGNIQNPQIVMGVIGRNEAGQTGFSRFWIRQNGQNVSTGTQSSNFVGTSIESTQFLRSSGVSTGGFFGGNFYELLIYSPIPPTPVLLEIEAFLRDLYGINPTT